MKTNAYQVYNAAAAAVETDDKDAHCTDDDDDAGRILGSFHHVVLLTCMITRRGTARKRTDILTRSNVFNDSSVHS